MTNLRLFWAVITLSLSGLCLPGALRAQSAEATGTSTLTISGSQVLAYGITQLDYTSAVYYNLGATTVLYQGPNNSSLSIVGQDNEVAPNRSLVSANVTVPLVANQVYQMQTAHYMDLVYVVGAEYDDEYGFSYLESDSDWEVIDVLAPDTQVFIGESEVDFGDTFDFGADIGAILTSPALSDVISSPQDMGDGTYQVTLSSEAYTSMMDAGFLDANTVRAAFVLCPFVPEACAVVAIEGAIVYYGARLILTKENLQFIYNVFSQRIPSPFGWLGDDPNVAPPGMIPVPTGTGRPAYKTPDGRSSAYPDLTNPAHAPHWDYTDKNRKPKSWKIWKDGTMSPEKESNE